MTGVRLGSDPIGHSLASQSNKVIEAFLIVLQRALCSFYLASRCRYCFIQLLAIRFELENRHRPHQDCKHNAHSDYKRVNGPSFKCNISI